MAQLSGSTTQDNLVDRGFSAHQAAHKPLVDTWPHLLQVEDNGAVAGFHLCLVLESIRLHVACELGHRVRIAG